MQITLKSIIDNSTIRFSKDQIDEMAVYIGDMLDIKYGSTWQVFLYGDFSTNCDFKSSTSYANRWAKLTMYGRYKFSYCIFNTHTCRASIKTTLQG